FLRKTLGAKHCADVGVPCGRIDDAWAHAPTHRRRMRRRAAAACGGRFIRSATGAPSDAPAGVPGLDNEVVGGLAEADDRQLGDVGPEEVIGACRAVVAVNLLLAAGVVDLLQGAAQLRVAAPVRGVDRSAVQCEAVIAKE